MSTSIIPCPADATELTTVQLDNVHGGMSALDIINLAAAVAAAAASHTSNQRTAPGGFPGQS